MLCWFIGEIQDIEFFFKLSRENFSFLKKSLKGQRDKVKDEGKKQKAKGKKRECLNR